MDLIESVPKEELNWLSAFSKLLNGQLRGVLNKIAREENLQLIQLTMGKIYVEAYNKGLIVGFNSKLEENLDKQIEDKIKEIIPEIKNNTT